MNLVSWMKTKGEAGGVCLIALLLFAYAMALPAAENADDPLSEPKPSQAERTELPEMTVTASPTGETSYNAYSATTATKTDTPIMETPLSIQVVPQQVLRDQQAINLGDAIKNVSGVQFSNSYSTYDNFLIRGFKTDYDGTSILRNGLRRGANNYELANIEQVEVLKGPAAILYGRVEPGGVVNFVTKMPLASPYYAFQQQFGSYDLYRTTLDATGPVTQDQTLLYRFNLAYQDYGGFRDFLGHDRFFVAPSLTWRPSERTEVTFEFEYKRDWNLMSDQGVPVIGRKPAPVSKHFSLGEEWAQDTFDSYLAVLDWSHRLTDQWTIRNRFMADLTNYKFLDIGANSLLPGDRAVDRWIYDAEFSRHRYATNLDLLGKFEALGAEHSVLLGFDYYQFNPPNGTTFFGVLPAAYNIDLFAPQHGAPRPASQPPNGFHNNFYDWYGVYFQDQVALWDGKVHLLFGGRYDWAKIKDKFSPTSFADMTETKLSDEAFSPRVGILYQPWPWLSLYGNFTESFGANNGRTADRRPLDPQRATQYELGVKTEFLDGRLTSTLAFYHLTKSNLPTADLNTPDPSDLTLVGEARSRGIEFDLSGQLTDKLNLIGSFSYTDARITKDNDGFAGNRLFAVPEFFGSVWAKYRATEAFSFGSGIFAATESAGDRANSFDTPGYVRWDAMAAYRFKIAKSWLTAQVNVNNITDERYYENSEGGRLGVTPADPRTVLGSIRIEW